MKKVLISILGMLLLPSLLWAAECRTLIAPQTKPIYYATVCFNSARWNYDQEFLVVEVDLGYVEGAKFIKTSNDAITVKNVEAVPDNPKTPENESKPANPVYDTFKAVLNSSNLAIIPLEVLIMDNIVKAKYPY